MNLQGIMQAQGQTQEALNCIYQKLEMLDHNNQEQRKNQDTSHGDLCNLVVQLINQNNMLVQQQVELSQKITSMESTIGTVLGGRNGAILNHASPLASTKKGVRKRASSSARGRTTLSKAAQAKREEAFQKAKEFVSVPQMKSHPTYLYKIYFENPYGNFKGLVQLEKEAKLLKLPMNSWLKGDVQQRYRQLKRIAELYKRYYDQECKTSPPREYAHAPDSYYHEQASLRLEAYAYEHNAWPSRSVFGKDSLQKLANYLQSKENPNKTRGRPRLRKNSLNDVALETQNVVGGEDFNLPGDYIGNDRKNAMNAEKKKRPRKKRQKKNPVSQAN